MCWIARRPARSRSFSQRWINGTRNTRLLWMMSWSQTLIDPFTFAQPVARICFPPSFAALYAVPSIVVIYVFWMEEVLVTWITPIFLKPGNPCRWFEQSWILFWRLLMYLVCTAFTITWQLLFISLTFVDLPTMSNNLRKRYAECQCAVQRSFISGD